MKIACISLGCPKNQVDLDVMVHILLSAGHETVADLAEADVILVNTCGFIESAKTEAIENILEACSYKQQNPELKKDYTIIMVTHNMQQAARISDRTAFFLLGKMIEYGETEQIFSMPKDKRTEDYITGRFG